MTDQVNEAVAKVIFTNRKKPDVEWLVDTVKRDTLLYAHPARGAVDDAKALADFTEYFVRNYPGPDTVISDPKWHAPRIFRAAQHALQAAQPAASGCYTCGHPKHAGYCVDPKWATAAKCDELLSRALRAESALAKAAQPAVPAVSDGEAVIDRNEGGEIVAVTRRGNEWVSLKVVADHTKLDQDAQPAVPSVPDAILRAFSDAAVDAAWTGTGVIRLTAADGEITAECVPPSSMTFAATPKDQPAQGVEP